MQLREIRDGKSVVTETEVPFEQAYDIIVCGGGTAGAIAAITAAKQGMKTLCIEWGTFLGGLGTGAVLGYYDGQGLTGMCQEIDEAIIDLSNAYYHKTKSWTGGIHPHAKMTIYEKEFKEAGGVVWYESFAAGVYMDGDRVRGIKAYTQSRMMDIGCRIIIDATAEANVCRLAHLPWEMGRKTDGRSQCYSCVYHMINEDQEIEHVYQDSGYVGTDNMWAISKAISKGYGTYTEAIRGEILSCAPILGIRQGISMIGKATLEAENLFDGVPIKEPVFLSSASYDSHFHDMAFEEDRVKDWCLVAGLRNLVLDVPVPFGAMVPEGIEGIIAAGICMDINHSTLGPVRLKKNVMRSGETAALAATIAIQTKRNVEECYPKLKVLLQERGLLCEQGAIPPLMLDAEQDLKTFLSAEDGTKAGCGIWMGSKSGQIEQLVGYLQDENGTLADNAALALGLAQDPRCIERLQEMAKAGRKEGAAIYCLGKLADGEEVVGLLEEKLRKEKDYNLFTHTWLALLMIAGRGNQRAATAIRGLLEQKDFSCTLLLRGFNNAGVPNKTEERCNDLRRYTAKIFDQHGIVHKMYDFLEKEEVLGQ